jgi:glycosyltransferase involved in cell wall biosynthesis
VTLIARDTNSGGCAAPRNDGIARATGTHLAFLDGDDIWQPDKIATQIAALAAFPEIGLLFSDYLEFDNSGGRDTRARARAYAATDGDQLRRFFIHGGPILPSCAVVSRAAIDKAGVFDPDMPFNEDAEYWLRIAAVAPIHHQPVALVRKRAWYGSLGSAKYALQNQACQNEITERMLLRVPDLSDARAAREARIDYKTALHFFATGEVAAARRHLRSGLALDPGHARARLALVLSYLTADPEAALSVARRLWARRPRAVR